MTRGCRKCGCERIAGPIYSEAKDALVYHCTRCGFAWSTAPRDARETSDLDDWIERAQPVHPGYRGKPNPKLRVRWAGASE